MEANVLNFPWIKLLERLLMTLLCGGIIGLEREWARKVAGLRTMILICMGSGLYMSVSELAALTAGYPFDITRIAAQVVTGVGFIGAGTIIVGRGRTLGVTTAATIWVVAAIGLIIGAGYPLFGLVVTLIVLFVLLLVKKVEEHFLKPLIVDDNENEDVSEEADDSLRE